MDTRTYADRREYKKSWSARNPEKRREYDRRVYQKNPIYAKYRKEQAMARYKESREFVDSYKLRHGCIDCGYSEHACALQFDHRDPQLKLFTIAEKTMSNREMLIAEMEKCDVRCANCHAVKTKICNQNGPRKKGGSDNVSN